MAHFAHVDQRGIVTRVIVISNDDIKEPGGNENEAMGIAICERLTGMTGWLQCSYNSNFRGCYPGPGYTYDPAADVFVPPPQPAQEAES
jgi:hypothetical protein